MVFATKQQQTVFSIASNEVLIVLIHLLVASHLGEVVRLHGPRIQAVSSIR